MIRMALAAGPAFAFAVGLTMQASGMETNAVWTGGVTAWCAVWWVLEPIPIPATSLIPLAVFPLVGVLKADVVAAAYGDELILLLLGGLMLSSSMERSGAHRRIALTMVKAFGGTSGRRLVLGFMAASAGLSMWISNMATTLMLFPIVMAIVEKSDEPRLRRALLLGVAYAASVGGTGTPVGTPPNLIFMKNYQQATGQQLAFSDWMSWAMPVVLVMIPTMAIWLTRGLPRRSSIALPSVGSWRAAEVRTLLVFVTTALLWVTRREPFGGWSEALGIASANDASVALLAVVAMFLIPNGEGEKLLDWETAMKIPWGILILFSSGIVIAQAFASSGLSALIGQSLTSLAVLPSFALIGLVALSVTFLTELTSNTATANLLMPILAATAKGAGVDPRSLMVPAAISASFAFMLPVATGPNAIVFSSNELTVRDMAREGLALNLVGGAIVTLMCYWRFG